VSNTITVKLPDPIETHAGYVSEASFRAPTVRDFLLLGEPQRYIRSPEGSLFIVDDLEALAAYLDKCVMPPIDPVIMAGTSLANGIAMREAVLRFFVEQRDRALAPPSGSSSSISELPPSTAPAN
jgi:hypothetical protein